MRTEYVLRMIVSFYLKFSIGDPTCLREVQSLLWMMESINTGAVIKYGRDCYSSNIDLYELLQFTIRKNLDIIVCQLHVIELNSLLRVSTLDASSIWDGDALTNECFEDDTVTCIGNQNFVNTSKSSP